MRSGTSFLQKNSADYSFTSMLSAMNDVLFLFSLLSLKKESGEAYKIILLSVRLSSRLSACMCQQLIIFEAVGGFLLNSAGKSCH
jgi:hypothetical protein